jgi:predicted lipoprotein
MALARRARTERAAVQRCHVAVLTATSGELAQSLACRLEGRVPRHFQRARSGHLRCRAARHELGRARLQCGAARRAARARLSRALTRRPALQRMRR